MSFLPQNFEDFKLSMIFLAEQNVHCGEVPGTNVHINLIIVDVLSHKFEIFLCFGSELP